LIDWLVDHIFDKYEFCSTHDVAEVVDAIDSEKCEMKESVVALK
jgi:hypothetical protein